MISSVEYAGSSIWKKHVWDSGSMLSLPLCFVSLNGVLAGQLDGLGRRHLPQQNRMNLERSSWEKPSITRQKRCTCGAHSTTTR